MVKKIWASLGSCHSWKKQTATGRISKALTVLSLPWFLFHLTELLAPGFIYCSHFCFLNIFPILISLDQPWWSLRLRFLWHFFICSDKQMPDICKSYSQLNSPDIIPKVQIDKYYSPFWRYTLTEVQWVKVTFSSIAFLLLFCENICLKTPQSEYKCRKKLQLL